MDACDVKVTDVDCFLASNMMIKAKNTPCRNVSGSMVRPASSCFIPCIPTLAPHCTREEPDLHLEFCLRDVTDGMRSPWKLHVGGLEDFFQEIVTDAMKIANTIQPVVGSGFHSSGNEDVDHDALWLASLDWVRQPQAHAPTCLVTDCNGPLKGSSR